MGIPFQFNLARSCSRRGSASHTISSPWDLEPSSFLRTLLPAPHNARRGNDTAAGRRAELRHPAGGHADRVQSASVLRPRDVIAHSKTVDALLAKRAQCCWSGHGAFLINCSRELGSVLIVRVTCRRKATAGPPERKRRDQQPLRKGRQAGADQRQGRHPLGIGPAAPDLGVEPLAEDRVSEAAEDSDYGNDAESGVWPASVTGDQERADQCRAWISKSPPVQCIAANTISPRLPSCQIV